MCKSILISFKIKIKLWMLLKTSKLKTKKIKISFSLFFTYPIVFFVRVWEHTKVYRAQSCLKCDSFIYKILKEKLFCRTQHLILEF